MRLYTSYVVCALYSAYCSTQYLVARHAQIFCTSYELKLLSKVVRRSAVATTGGWPLALLSAFAAVAAFARDDRIFHCTAAASRIDLLLPLNDRTDVRRLSLGLGVAEEAASLGLSKGEAGGEEPWLVERPQPFEDRWRSI